MAADETDSDGGAPKPVRSGRSGRVPPVIEAEAVSAEPDAASAEPAAPLAEDAGKPGPSSDVSPAAARASRLPLIVALLAGVGGLGLAGYGWLEAQQSAASLAALARDVAALRGQAPPRAAPFSATAGADLARRIEALEKRPLPDTSGGEAWASLTQRVEALDRRLQALAAAPAPASGNAPALEGRLAALEHAAQAPAAAPAGAPVDLAPVEAKLAGLDSRIAALETEMRATKTEVRAREAPLAAVSQRGQVAGLAVVAQVIAQAVEHGTPFAADLKSAESLGADASLLAPLRAVAETGAPDVRALQANWAAVSRKAIAADGNTATGEAPGLLERLGASAARLVRVRPVGDVGGDDAASVAARIEAALGRGAIGEALAAWERLPAPAKAVSTAFAEAAHRRLAAEDAARALVSAAVADLARPKGAP